LSVVQARNCAEAASQPYVLGVGGTTIGATSENVWNNSSINDGADGSGL
jgi:hypothetical protein